MNQMSWKSIQFFSLKSKNVNLLATSLAKMLKETFIFLKFTMSATYTSESHISVQAYVATTLWIKKKVLIHTAPHPDNQSQRHMLPLNLNCEQKKRTILKYGSNLAWQALHVKQTTTQIIAWDWVFSKNLTRSKTTNLTIVL